MYFGDKSFMSIFMDKKAHSLRILMTFIVSIFSIAVYNSMFYPGYLTPDSAYILYQMSGLQPLSNWHPIFVTIMWGILYDVFKSTGGIWTIQILIFVSACACMSLKIKNGIVGLLFLAVALLYPPMMTNMGALWKDDFAVIFTLISAVSLINYCNRKTKSNMALLLLSCIIVSLIRVDYFIVILPFIVAAALLSTKELNLKYRFIHVVFYLFVTSISVVVINKALSIGVEKELNPWVTIAAWDIAGVEQRSGISDLSKIYNCNTSDPLVWGRDARFSVNLPEGEYVTPIKEESSYFFKLWFNSVVRHPVLYVEHRMCVAKIFLGFNTSSVHYPYPSPVFNNYSLSQKSDRSRLNLDAYWFFDANATSPMFRYWYYLVVVLVVTAIMNVIGKFSFVHNAISASILLTAFRVLVLPAADFRYGIWIVLGTLVLIFMFIDRVVYKGKGY